MSKKQIEPTQLDAVRGASEARTEPYMKYGEGGLERGNEEMRQMCRLYYSKVKCHVILALLSKVWALLY